MKFYDTVMSTLVGLGLFSLLYMSAHTSKNMTMVALGFVLALAGDSLWGLLKLVIRR